ncbi:MAG: efflux RND transporter periplasmic adaptor subunit [Acidobacteriota bacterium]|nr:efflux RND transporter periplasmic adaptor subunit [Acidobacteriota bacterium]
MSTWMREVGFRRAAAVAAGVVLCAALTGTARVSAQNPGLGGGKKNAAEPPIVQEEAFSSSKPKGYVVEAGEVLQDVVLTGELKAERSISILAPRIQSSFNNTLTYMADEGSVVHAGELVVEFDDSTLLSSRSDAEKTLDENKLKISKQKADLEADRCDQLNSVAQAEATLKKAQLYAKIDKSLLSANDYQKYQLDLLKAKLSLEKAKESLKNFEDSYDSQMALVEIDKSQAEINLKKIDSDMTLLKMYAPQDGIFIYGDNWQNNRKVQPGDTIFPGAEVASIPDLESMQVVGYVYDTEYGKIKAEMPCTVTLDALPGYEVGGRVVSLTSVASRRGFSSEKKLFQTVIRLDKVDSSKLKPGMTARINIPLVLAKGVTTVPREYVGTDSKGKSYVVKGTSAKDADTQFVEVGSMGDKLVEVKSGVSVGDKLLPVQFLAEVTKK